MSLFQKAVGHTVHKLGLAHAAAALHFLRPHLAFSFRPM